MDLRQSLDQPVSDYMSASFARVSFDDSVRDAARVMQKAGATEAVVVRGDDPIGIITERDILYKVVAAGLDPSATRVRDVISAPVATVDSAAKVADAIAKMSKLGVRRLGVTRKGKLVGLVTQKAMVSGGLEQHVALPELASPNLLACPYCGEIVGDRDELSRHIDRVHLGLGLLEGDLSKW
ncbi:MAG: CBS domain-containing protein [Nitrososphaerales archaeon]|jgi:CBS domain-containing protein